MAFDDIAPIYDETRIIPNWVLYEFYKRILKKDIQSNHNLVVLDAGIGTGRTVMPLLDLNIQLVGIDLSKKMLRKMTEKLRGRVTKGQISLLVGDVTQLPFRDVSFDLIISVHVLHLLKKWKQAIQETKRVLKPKGSFAVASHNAPELDNEMGRKYLELCHDTFQKRGAPKKLSTRLDISKRMRIVKGVFENKGMNLLNRALEKVTEYNSWESYLRRKVSSTETYAILWKEAISIYKIVDLLNKRFLSMKGSLSTEAHEKLKLELAKWRIEKIKKSPLLEIRREFKFTKVQF